MNVDDLFRRNVRMFYSWFGSVVVLGAGPLLALRLIHAGTPLGRAAGVVVGVVSILPWMWVVVGAIRCGDEFTRRLYSIASSISLGGTLVVISALDWLARARFIDPPELIVVWVFSIVLWLVAFIGVKRYYERAQ
ncbi:MAG TPA: hypothetical protein VFV98_06440 [Vicinamibacterales bacterium]|nr:hypothetical protein [Vicinamibacterales bacterium]